MKGVALLGLVSAPEGETHTWTMIGGAARTAAAGDLVRCTQGTFRP